MKKYILIIALITAASVATLAQKPAIMSSTKPGWHKIATQTVNYKVDKDEVSVLGNDRFKEIRLKALDAPVDIMSFDVYFEKASNDSISRVQTIRVNKTLNAGEETAATALNKDLAIKRIVLVYKTMPNRNDKGEKQKAQLEIWGRK